MNNVQPDRAVAEGLEHILGVQYAVLDHGFVRVVDYMGNDAAIVQAARVSYGAGTKGARDDAQLIDYLMRNRHTTPFEMAEIKFHVKLPIFVARQWIRHRTASVNEVSGRYSEIKDEVYVPETVEAQSKANRQGRDRGLSKLKQENIRELIRKNGILSRQAYTALLNDNTARELARTVLPVNVYTEWYWKIDLHNLFHFLALRTDPHAQAEIRRYADVIDQIVRMWCPMAHIAWERHVKEGVRCSREEWAAIKMLINGRVLVRAEETALSTKEFDQLLQRLDLVPKDSRPPDPGVEKPAPPPRPSDG